MERNSDFIQFLLCSSLWTDLNFLVAMEKSSGYCNFRAPSGNHLSCQNKHRFQFPTKMSVHARKSSISAALHGSAMPCHGRSWSVHANQGHLSLNALPNFSMSKMPKPPRSFGRQIVLQFTSGWGLVLGAAPGFIHRKLLLILSIFLMIHFGSLRTAKW